MKQELINRIMPNCLLPMYYMVTWINNLVFQNEPADALRQLIISKVKSNGQLLPEGWDLLLNNVIFEDNASITSSQALGWINAQNCPTCNQLQQIILDLKLNNSFPLVVETNVLNTLELEIDHDPTKNFYNEMNSAFMRNGMQYYVVRPVIKIKNFDLIKDAEPYLIVERLTPTKKCANRKSGWKRDKTLCNLNGNFWQGFGIMQSTLITEDGEFYRPNNIPITNQKQRIDFKFENYFKVWQINNNRVIAKRGNGRQSSNYDVVMPPHKWDNSYANPNNDFYSIRTLRKQKINLRLRIAYKIGNIEKISQPLKYFSIFAVTYNKNTGNSTEQQVLISIGK